MTTFITSNKKTIGLSIALLVLNGFIFLNRQHGFGYRYLVTPHELYANQESEFITDLRFKTDTAIISWNKVQPMANYLVMVNDTFRLQARTSGQQLFLPLKPGINFYNLRKPGLLVDTFSMGIDYVCTASDYDQGCLNELIACNVPFWTGKPLPVKTWAINKRGVFSSHEIETGTQILRQKDPLIFSRNPIDRAKIVLQLAAGLTAETSPRGLESRIREQWPADSLFRFLSSSKHRLNCGDLSYMAAYFAIAARLPVRSVALKDGKQYWSTAVHYFTEIFDSTRGSWLMLDPMNNLLAPLNLQGQPLGPIQFQQSFAISNQIPNGTAWYAAGDGVYQRKLSDWQPVLRPYYQWSGSPISYDIQSTRGAYSMFDRLIDFYTLPKKEMVYSPFLKNNWPLIYAKLVFFWGMILVWIWVIFRFIKSRNF